MKNSILVTLNDSISSCAVVDFLINLALCPEDIKITLLHVFRKPSEGEELMGKKFMFRQPEKFINILNSAKERLVEKGFNPDDIFVNLVIEPYPTVADGIIDQFNKGRFNIVLIGRKNMSKAEEFVLGDPSIKLVRSLKGVAVLVVKL